MVSTKKKGRDSTSASSKKSSKKEATSTPVEAATEEKKSNDGKTGSVDEHPLQNGHYLVVKYRDGSNRLAKIVEGSVGSSPRSTQYYIHYCDFNRRMDEWIDSSRIIAYPSEANPMGENREAQENLAKKMKSIDSKGNLVELDKKPSDVTSSSDAPFSPPVSSPRALLGSGNQRSGQKSRSNSIAGVNPTAIISTVADMDHDEHEGMDEESLLEHEAVTKIKNIKYVKLGKYIMECWYFSPFPKEYYPNGFAECLYFCEFSFRFFKTRQELQYYQKKPNLSRHPPGNEIYRDNDVSMFELDGAVEKIYCQNLCYFAKLFLDHKTLYWDVDPFLFYVLCTRDDRGFHPVGYFSKEKYSDMGYNLACILTFPSVQRTGYGRFLMSFSYELSKKEEKAGSPEKPLSDLGAVGYKSCWAHTILKTLRDYQGQMISIMDITRLTSILPEDIQSTLNMLGLIHNIGTNTTNTNSTTTITGINNNTNTNSNSTNTTITNDINENNTNKIENEQQNHYVLYAPLELIEELLLKYPDGKLPVQPEKLHWAPLYVTDPKKDKWSIRSLLKEAKDKAASENMDIVVT